MGNKTEVKGNTPIEKYQSNLPIVSTSKKIRLATLFSGIGAVEQAFLRLKVDTKIVFGCDNNNFVKQSYFANYDVSEENWYKDILELDAKKYKGKIDILVGGSPCQSFSSVGKRKGLDDDRGNLIYEFIRIVDESQPNVFIFENVKGLVTHDSGKTWKDIILPEFELLGYNIHYEILNSKNYGIPQHRDRLFVVGFKKKVNFSFPNPVPLELKVHDLLEDNADEKYYLGKKGFEFVFTVNNKRGSSTQVNGEIALCQRANQQFNWHGDFILDYGPVNDKYFLSEAVKKYVLAVGTKGYKTRTETNLEIARPLLSTMASMHRAGVDNYFMYGPRIRKLTPKECLRLMGFSDKYKIVVSDTQAYKQAGNSMVVDVLMHLFSNIINAMKWI
jgi:DNA (cytosine-5)-methyltransferase 1